MNYRRHIQDSEEVLADYSVYKETRYQESLIVFKASLKSDPSMHFCIKREVFEISMANLERFESLLLAKNKGLIAANMLFLEEEDSQLICYSVEPLFTNQMASSPL